MDDGFDRSISDFAEAYTEQNQRDYDTFTTAIKEGRVLATEGI